jgi:hypothetical protein
MSKIIWDTIDYYETMAKNEKNPRIKKHYEQQALKLRVYESRKVKKLS